MTDHQIIIESGKVDQAKTRLPEGFSISQDNHITINVAENIVSKSPIILLINGDANDLQINVNLAQSSEALFFQQFDQSFKSENLEVKVQLSDNAKLELVTLFHHDNQQQKTTTHQGRDSQFTHYHLSLMGDALSHQMHINLEKSGATCELNGIYLLADKNTSDHDIVINHQHSNTHSRQFYKGILDGQSEASFRGKVVVAKDAQKIEAYQQNHNLLLSEKAQVASKPELEIYADDVKCSHGATVGQLDEAALFYLRSRGIAADKARQILTKGFLHDVFMRFPSSLQSVFSAKHPLLEMSDVS